jgi:hypothetical protein
MLLQAVAAFAVIMASSYCCRFTGQSHFEEPYQHPLLMQRSQDRRSVAPSLEARLAALG